MKELKNGFIYTLEDKPPLADLVLLGLQHLIKFLLLLICPITILNVAHASPNLSQGVICISLIMGAITTLLIASRKFNAGYFIPIQSSVPLYASLLMGAKMGGMAMVFGMTIVFGLLQCLMTPFIYLIKKLLDETVIGFMILLIGVWAALLGVNELFRPGNIGQLIIHTNLVPTGPLLAKQAWIGFISLAVMIGLRLSKQWRLYCILLGMLSGWILAFLSVGLSPEKLAWLKQAAWFAFPSITSSNLNFLTDFDWRLLLPLALIALLSSLEILGLFATIDSFAAKPQDKFLNLKKFTRGNITMGLSASLSGVLGGFAQAPVPASLGDFIATGAYSRCIAYVYAFGLLVLAFCPKFTFIFLTIPAEVNGAAIVFMGAMMIIKGVGMLHLDRLIDRQAHAFSIAFLLALSMDILPQFYLHQQGLFLWFTHADLLFGLVLFIVLRLIFNIGQKHV